MAGVSVKIPGTAGIVEAKAAQMAKAVQLHWDVATAPPEKKVRWPGAGDLVQTAKFGITRSLDRLTFL